MGWLTVAATIVDTKATTRAVTFMALASSHAPSRRRIGRGKRNREGDLSRIELNQEWDLDRGIGGE
jgi:hypothetical protein